MDIKGIKAIFVKIIWKIYMYDLKINFEQKGLEAVTLNNIKSGDSLLEVILEAGIELHHNCGAVCACSTCHLYVNKGMAHLAELSDREEDFIDRALIPRIESRLGCQCVIQEGSGTIEVTLPDQTQFLGE
jgi:2Fe-2S ferredoxin